MHAQCFLPAVAREAEITLAPRQRRGTRARFGVVGRGPDLRQRGEGIGRRRDRHGPFERRRPPRIAPHPAAVAELRQDVDHHQPEADGHDEPAHRGQKVEPVPADVARIGVDAPGHAEQADQVHQEEGQVEADENQPEGGHRQAMDGRAAGQQRQPVVERRQHRKGQRAGHDVVKVGDDEIAVMRLPVERHDGEHDAGQAAQREDEEEPEDIEHRHVPARSAMRQGGEPGEDLHGRRHRDNRRAGGEEGEGKMGDAHGEHVVHPDAEAHEGQRNDRHDDRPVTDEAPVGEDRDDRRQGSGHRQEDDVDVGVTEQPEQMLPEQRIAAPLGVEERQAEGALGFEQDRAQDQRRKGHHHHQRGDQHVPAEDRHPIERHARRAHLEDRDDDLDGQRQRRDLDERHPEQPDIGVDARRVDVRAERRIHEPAAIGRDPEDQRKGQDGAAEQVAPVAVGGEPREGEIAGAENLRREVDRHALDHGDGEQEQHHRPVHGEDLVVGLRVHEVGVGRSELDAGQHAEHAADREEDERRGHEAQADDGMVDGGEALQAGPSGPDRGELAVQPQRAHCCSFAACASAAAKSSARWTTTANRILVWPRPQNSEQRPS